MKGSQSLEDERQAILARMRASREEYRRLLGGATHEQHEASAARNPLLEEEVYEAPHGAPVMHHAYAYGDDLHSDGHGGTMSSYRATHQHEVSQRPDARQLALAALGTATMVVKRHPLAVAAVVAALVAIGPRRVIRGAAKGGTVVAALTLRNPRNIGMLTRLITTVADIVQRGRARHPP